MLASKIPGCEQRFTLLFSDGPFPGSQTSIQRLREEAGGNWYECEGVEGWLCPALYRYFAVAPEKIYLQIKEAKA